MTVEELQEYGLEEMTDEEISNFLLNRGFGVLGLPTGGAPYLLPLSFGYDGESTIYFSFFVGEESRKVELCKEADMATFLVFSPDSVFSWESVSILGAVSELPAEQWDEHEAAMDNAWHLDLFKQAETAGTLELFTFDIDEQVGLKSMGLPPGMQEEHSSGDSSQ